MLVTLLNLFGISLFRISSFFYSAVSSGQFLSLQSFYYLANTDPFWQAFLLFFALSLFVSQVFMHHWDRDISGRLQRVYTPTEQGCEVSVHSEQMDPLLGFSFSCELGFSGSLIRSFSSAIFVSSKRKPVSYGGSYLPALRESLGDGTWSHKWADEATNSTHSADLLETTLLGLIPSRSKVGRPDLVLPPLLTDLVTTVLHALACSVLDVSCSSDIVVPISWVPNPDLGNSSCLRLGPRIGGKATPSKSHPDVPVQRWLIKNIRSATAVAITGEAGNTDSRDAVCVSNIAVGKIVEAADPEAVIPRVAVDNLIVAGRPNMGSFRASKARIADSRIADVGLSDRQSLKILGTAPTSSKRVHLPWILGVRTSRRSGRNM